MIEFSIDQLTEIGKAISFDYREGNAVLPAFVLKTGEGQFVAYINSCPHVHAPLDYGDDDFWYDKIDRIVCKVHGATFETLTGICDSGPCTGESLRKLTLRVEGNRILIS